MSVAFKLSNSEFDSLYDCVAIDTIFLNRNTFHDATLRTEIIGLFLAQLDGVQNSFHVPIDKNGWTFLTHTLKGAASAVGALQLAALADYWGKQPAPQTTEQRQIFARQLAALIADFKRMATQL
jgi:HPt (histidine-containing phosphotransfer) domain-containing protein